MIALLVALVACGPDPATSEAPVDPAGATVDASAPADLPVDGPLSAEEYRFCHVPGADAAHAREFCDLLADLPDEACPGLRATCDEGAEESVLDPSGCQGMGGEPGSTPAAPPDPPREPWKLDLEPLSCETPTGWAGWLTLVAQWTSAILVALVVLVLLRLVIKALGWARPKNGEVAPIERAIVHEVPPSDEIPDTPGEDLLGAAQAALDAGRWGDAVLLARAASLRRLADAGRIKLHRSRTDREYLRTVRRDAPVHEALGDVLTEVEAERWGARGAGESAARRVLDAARRILGIVAATCLLAMLVAASSSWRYGPQGDAALFAMLAERGHTVTWRLRGFSSLADDTDFDVLVIDLSGIRPTGSDWEAIRAWVTAGGLVVVAGDAEVGIPALGAASPLPDGTPVHAVDWLRAEVATPRFAGGPRSGWIDGQGDPWVVTGADGSDANARLMAGEAPPAPAPESVVVQSLPLGLGLVVAIADARLLWNGSLVAPENAGFLGDLPMVTRAVAGLGVPPDAIQAFESPVRVQLATSASAGSDNPVGALANARLLPFVLQLLALVVLGALWKGWPFGPLRDPPDEGRLRFADHVRAVGSGYARRRASRHAFGAYAALWLARLGPAGIEQAARQSGRSADDAKRLVDAARAAAESRDEPSNRADLERMEDLWRITKRA